MLGLLPLTFALQLATPVSFDGSVGAYAAKISEKSDHTYLVAGDLRDEPILIRTNTLDLDSTRVRELVAQAIEGVWIDPKPGQSHLSIPPKQLAALRDRDREERQRALSNWLRELARDTRRSSQAQVANVLAELSTFEQREKEGRFTRNGTRSYQAPTPDFELLKSLLVELGSTALAAIEPGDLAIWSNVPMRDQQPLPSTSVAAIANYERACESLASALAKEDLPKTYSYPWEPLFSNLQKDRRSCKYVLTAMPTHRASLYRLRIFDKSGEFVEVAALMGPVSGAKRPPELSERGFPNHLPLTGSSTEFLRHYTDGNLYLRQTFRREAPLDAKFLASSDFEALGVGTGEVLSWLCEASGKTVIAYLPDTAIGAALACSKGDSVDAAALWKQLLADGAIDLVESDDAIVLRPSNPVLARRERVDRPALRAYVQKVLERPGTTPRDECRFMAAGGPGSVLSAVSVAYNKCLLPLVSVHFNQIRYWLGALLGSVTDAQWLDLEAGRPVRIRSLSDGQRASFRKWLEVGGPGHYNYEPSVCASNVIYDYELFLNLAEDPLLQCVTRGDGDWGGQPVVPMRLSQFAMVLRTVGIQPDRLSATLTGRYEVTVSTSYTAVGRLGRVDWVTDDVGDLPGTTKLTDLTFGEWPDTLRSRLAQMMGG